ncbi:hypothetical protein N7474_003460 [Penicillium riverlandense]|uniref:uncharacterized protein n=1 Tax=Penicillium riverlandense TaxID=1903569 RepID=UPI00254956B2|nr:uncharacterized protein N7474_003460 [Penicillium riverlandense]KAJ5826322.1 hypothetical protein N7474_003460 [Penicillium riverlandense]
MSFELSDVDISDAEVIARDIEVPAMQNVPLYRIMFPSSDSMQATQLDQIIRWYTDMLEDALRGRWESFLKACTVDDKPVGFCAWTLEAQTNERQPVMNANAKENLRKREKRGKKNWLPEILDVEQWLSVSARLRKERERVFGDLNSICRLTFMSVNPDYQRQGIGSMLMQRICEEANLHGRQAYVLASPEGVRLYAKFGFQVVGGVDTPQGTITSMLRQPQQREVIETS